jgi:hypothetical protein
MVGLHTVQAIFDLAAQALNYGERSISGEGTPLKGTTEMGLNMIHHQIYHVDNFCTSNIIYIYMYVYMIYVLYNTSRRVGNRSSG